MIGTALDATQLNASTDVSGTFAYSPDVGTVLGLGNNQTLSVTFTPTDSTDYATVTQTASIHVGQAQTITGFSFSLWLYAGDTLSSVDYQFTSAAFGGTVYASGTTSLTLSAGASNSWLSAQYGVVQYTATATGLNLSVPVGTSWLALQNAVTASGNRAFWGENDGSSQAVENTIGSISSESFSIAGVSGNLYNNGSDPGTINAWTLNWGYAVTNSFFVHA